MKHNINEFILFFKMLCFVSKGSLNIPEHICLLISRVQYLYIIEHIVENRFESISVTLLSLGRIVSGSFSWLVFGSFFVYVSNFDLDRKYM